MKQMPTFTSHHRGIAATVIACLALAVAAALGTLAPAARAAGGTWTTDTIAGMTVRLYTPGSQPAIGGGRALMINLHGCQQKSQDLQQNGNWEEVADQYGMIVAIPDAPDGGVLLGCWDYYGTDHSAGSPSRHDDNLLALTQTLQGRQSLDIDPDQTYISGFSSGGGETIVMGCLFPDLFAGIGVDAGPSAGTTSTQYSTVAVSEATATSTCTGWAGGKAQSFQTQLASVVYGSNDNTVAQGYNTLNAHVMAGIYGASSTSTFDLSALTGTNKTGSGTLYSDANGPRVSLIQNTGLGHSWPAGAGAGGTYISANSIDYPAYVTKFFFEHNRRVDRSAGPTPSPSGTATPTPTPTPTPPTSDCVTATNGVHAAAGRATSYGIAPYVSYFAVGSYGYMGQGSSTVTSLQRQPTTGWNVVAGCN